MSCYRLAAAGKSKVKAVCAAPGLAATNLQVCLKYCCYICVRILFVLLLYMCLHTTPLTPGLAATNMQVTTAADGGLENGWSTKYADVC